MSRAAAKHDSLEDLITVGSGNTADSSVGICKSSFEHPAIAYQAAKPAELCDADLCEHAQVEAVEEYLARKGSTSFKFGHPHHSPRYPEKLAAARRELKKHTKKNLLDRRLWLVFQQMIDVFDYAVNRPENQPSNEMVLAQRAGERGLRKMRQKDVIAMRRGITSLYVRSRWCIDNPYVLVRFDLDEHGNLTGDGARAARWLADTFWQYLSHAPSRRGYSVYMFLPVPRGISKKGVNWFLHTELGPAVSRLLTVQGFRLSHVEIKGGFNVFETKCGEDWMLKHTVQRAPAVKLANLDDAATVKLLIPVPPEVINSILLASKQPKVIAAGHAALSLKSTNPSVIPAEIKQERKDALVEFRRGECIETLMDQLGEALAGAPGEKQDRINVLIKELEKMPFDNDQTITAAFSEARKLLGGRARKLISETGDIFKNRCNIVSLAVREAVEAAGGDHHAVDAGTILHRVNELCNEYGLSCGQRDQDRDRKLLEIAKHYLGTYDPAMVGIAKTGPFYTGVDLKASRSLWMSFADDTINKLTIKLKKMHVAVPEEALLKKVMDHTLCTVTKNAAKSGACGIDAVMGMLLYHGIEVDHRVVSQCMTILIRFRLIFTNQKYTTGYCRRFAINPTVQRRLPFVRDVKLPLMAEQVFNDQATRYTTAEPGGPELHSQTVYYFPNRYIVGNHIADVAFDPSEPGYQSMMEGLNAEFGDEIRFST